MAQKMNMVLFMAMVLATMLHSSAAQTRHVVGEGLGWLVPPGGSAAYSTWASAQTFTVGDVLVFNFTTGIHDVAEVNRAAFDSCNSSSPISMSTNGPTTITLSSAGTHYYICTFARHCELGQKLAINVSAASTSPAPQPAANPPPAAATPPAPAASPVPASAPETYVVGDALGWLVPPGGPIAYETWARNKSFMVGDVLVFNYTTGIHDVAEVTKAAFDSCNGSSPISMSTNGPTRITLSSAGEHYYICTFARHCGLGQKLAINVSASAATSPSPAPQTPIASPAGAPAPAATPPSSIATPPTGTAVSPSGSTTPSTPSPVSAPPPPASSSAPSFTVAALPFTLLSVALAFLY